jgi:formylglycine-generating enzyme required for sulfatase activity
MNRSAFHYLLALLAALAAAAHGPGAENPESARALPAVIVRGTTFELVRIPAGEFQMGSEGGREKPRHRVQLRGFDLGRTEVTVRQFRAFTTATGYQTDAEKEGWTWVCCWSRLEGGSWRNPGFPQSEDDPVVALSWHDAVEFCKWLSAETGQQFRLPSEAEWEYAARAGIQEEYPPDLDVTAWYQANSQGKTHPVARQEPNAWRLYDMLGNAWEWVADVWSENYAGAPTDGSARRGGGGPYKAIVAGDARILRGGGWGLPRAGLRLAARPPFALHDRCNNSGLRIARSVRPGRRTP